MECARQGLRCDGLVGALRVLPVLGALWFLNEVTFVSAQEAKDDPATRRVAALLERLGGEAQWDEQAPGRPLIGARLGTTRITDEQLEDLGTRAACRGDHRRRVPGRAGDAL